jgi:hypothetical protein
LEAGPRLQFAVNGQVTQLKYYKRSGDTATSHTLSFWDWDHSTLLATAATSGETASGWQTVTLSSPVSVSTGTNYAVSASIPASGEAFIANFYGPTLTNDQVSSDTCVYNLSQGSFPNSTTTTLVFVDVSFVYQVSAPKYPHIALPSTWGDPSQFLEGGDIVAWTKVASNVNVTNSQGVVVPCNVWRAPQALNHAHIWSLS